MGKTFATEEEKRAYWKAINRRHYLKAKYNYHTYTIRMSNELFAELISGCPREWSLSRFIIRIIQLGLHQFDTPGEGQNPRQLRRQLNNIARAEMRYKVDPKLLGHDRPSEGSPRHDLPQARRACGHLDVFDAVVM